MWPELIKGKLPHILTGPRQRSLKCSVSLNVQYSADMAEIGSGVTHPQQPLPGKTFRA